MSTTTKPDASMTDAPAVPPASHQPPSIDHIDPTDLLRDATETGRHNIELLQEKQSLLAEKQLSDQRLAEMEQRLAAFENKEKQKLAEEHQANLQQIPILYQELSNLMSPEDAKNIMNANAADQTSTEGTRRTVETLRQIVHASARAVQLNLTQQAKLRGGYDPVLVNQYHAITAKRQQLSAAPGTQARGFDNPTARYAQPPPVDVGAGSANGTGGVPPTPRAQNVSPSLATAALPVAQQPPQPQQQPQQQQQQMPYNYGALPSYTTPVSSYTNGYNTTPTSYNARPPAGFMSPADQFIDSWENEQLSKIDFNGLTKHTYTPLNEPPRETDWLNVKTAITASNRSKAVPVTDEERRKAYTESLNSVGQSGVIGLMTGKVMRMMAMPDDTSF